MYLSVVYHTVSSFYTFNTHASFTHSVAHRLFIHRLFHTKQLLNY